MSEKESAQLRLEASRRRAEEQLEALRVAMHREVGWAPGSRSWLLLTLGLSSGLALALWIRHRRANG